MYTAYCFQVLKDDAMININLLEWCLELRNSDISRQRKM